MLTFYLCQCLSQANGPTFYHQLLLHSEQLPPSLQTSKDCCPIGNKCEHSSETTIGSTYTLQYFWILKRMNQLTSPCIQLIRHLDCMIASLRGMSHYGFGLSSPNYIFFQLFPVSLLTCSGCPNIAG